MNDLVLFLTYLLSCMGLTVLIVWPEGGPSGWVRDRVLRRLLPGPARGVLDCYVCLGFWSSLALSPLWWWRSGQWWVWTGCLMTPALFWLVLQSGSARDAGDHHGREDDDDPVDRHDDADAGA